MLRAIDTHIHLDHLDDTDAMLEEARGKGLGAWLVPGVSVDHWPDLIKVTECHDDVFAAPGVHPMVADRYRPADAMTLRSLLDHPGVVAIGEVGLDAQSDVPDEVQEELFVEMIRLAIEAKKPLLIHARRRTGRILELLRRERADQVGGIFHAFSASLEVARQLIDLGFALGIGGVVTYPNARRLIEVVRTVPDQSLVLETDAPYMTPVPYRGQQNRPAHLTLIADRVADLRGWSYQQAVTTTTTNACRLLGLVCQDDGRICTRISA